MRILLIICTFLFSFFLLGCTLGTGYPVFILKNTGESPIQVRAVYNDSLEEVKRIATENFVEYSETFLLTTTENKSIYSEEDNLKGKYYAFGIYNTSSITSYAIFENRSFTYTNPFGDGEWTFVYFNNDTIYVGKNIDSPNVEERDAVDAKEYLIEIQPPLETL